MLKAQPTAKGTGISIFGSYEDLICLYDTVHHLAETLHADNKYQKGQHQLLMNFAYEIRKGYSGSRLKEKIVTAEEQENAFIYGFQVVWTDILIFINALRNCAGYIHTDKLHQANLYMLEYIVETALFNYDAAGAQLIKEYIGQRINVGSMYAFIIYQAVHIKFISEKPGKGRFRKIPQLLSEHFSEWTLVYKELISSFEQSATVQNCEVTDLEFSDFPDIKW